MATFNCDLINKRVRANTVSDGTHQTFIASVTIPAGTQIAQNDVINIMDLMTKHVVTAIRVYTDDLDDGTTMAWDVGYAQLVPGTGYGGVNASGVAQDFLVGDGTTYTSPSPSDPDYYASGATFGRAAGFSTLTLASTATAANTGISGPVRVTATQTASTPTQTTADDVDRVIRFEFDVVRATPAPNPGVFVNMGGY
jgi:hypothetical protein